MMCDNTGERWVIVKRVGQFVIVRAAQGATILVLLRLASGAFRFVMELVK
jgi:hypothetical protein